MSEREPQASPASDWVSYRPEIKVLDCTMSESRRQALRAIGCRTAPRSR